MNIDRKLLEKMDAEIRKAIGCPEVMDAIDKICVSSHSEAVIELNIRFIPKEGKPKTKRAPKKKFSDEDFLKSIGIQL